MRSHLYRLFGKRFLDRRIKRIYTELLEKCEQSNCYEFDYYWEIWGILWYPWTLEINGKYHSFSVNDLSYKDLNKMCDLGLIELVEEFSNHESKDERDHKRYRLLRVDGNPSA